MKFEVPFIRPSLPRAEELARDYERIVANNWFTNFGPFENSFRQAAAEYVGSEVHATTVANATLGLDLAVRALVDCDARGGEPATMIVPSFTFAAGAEVIISNGMAPVFIDVEPTSLQPSIDDAVQYLEAHPDSTRGILLCNIFGVGNKDIAKWEQLAERFDIPLIIDSAAGFGSRYAKEELIGGRGSCEVFSLHATKPFAVGEGGLVVSKNEHLINTIRQLQNFGFDSTRRTASIGTNAKMQEINAAIGLRQLVGFDERLSFRQAALQEYKQGLPEFTFQGNDELSTVAFASVIAKNSDYATESARRLTEGSVEVRRYYDPLHLHPALARYAIKASSLEVTNDIAGRILSLPVHDHMNPDHIKRIINILNER